MKIAVFLPNWIGDAVMATPAVRALRESYRGSELIGVVKPYVAGALEGAPWFDRILLDDSRRWWRTAWQLRRAQVDWAVLFPNSFRSAWVAWLAGCERIIGYNRYGRRWLLTDALQPLWGAGGTLTPTPIVDDYNRLAERAGCPWPGHRLQLFTTAADEAAADEVWENLGDREVVCLNAGAAFGSSKHWYAESFAELAQELIDRRGCQVLVLCGPAERELARQIAGLTARPHMHTLADRPLSLGLTKACVRRCALLITTDSGPRHFATAFDRPVVTLFGPTHIAWTETYHPLGVHLQKQVECGPCQLRTCPTDHRCMKLLTPSEVFDAAQRLLAQPATKGIVMATLDIHPRYQAAFERQGLATAGDFLALQGVVCCGHPDRHVVRLTIGEGEGTIPAFLKREHRTRWRDRLANALAGFGFASKSRREYGLLRTLETTDIGGPEPLAAGEDDDGRAFLLVRELEGFQDLRQCLRELATKEIEERANVAKTLGIALARLHAAGFEHGDLYSKHILVKRGALPTVGLLDWQRGRRRGRVGWSRRWRDLAALDATLADDLATARERLIALHAYLRASRTPAERQCGLTLRTAAREIRRRTLRLLERRRIREMRQPPLPLGQQNLLWLDGEALLVTREFHAELNGQIPDWLHKASDSCLDQPRTEAVPLAEARFAQLVTRLASRPWQWLWSWLRRRPLVAPGLESMKVHFRLERYGVVLPRFLAAGQKHVKPWQMQSFLLTEPLADAVPLPAFLAEASASDRRAALRQAGAVLRQMHQALCYFEADKRTSCSGLLSVCTHSSNGPRVALATVHGIEQSHHVNPARARRDLAAVAARVVGTCSRTDLLRGLLAYLGQRRLTQPGKHFARNMQNRLPAPRRRAAA